VSQAGADWNLYHWYHRSHRLSPEETIESLAGGGSVIIHAGHAPPQETAAGLDWGAPAGPRDQSPLEPSDPGGSWATNETPAGLAPTSTAGYGDLTAAAPAVAAGTVVVNSGSLSLERADRLVDSSVVTVATGATLTLNGDDRILSLALSGTLAGSGTLSANRYDLNGGLAVANLGAGTLRSIGSSQLQGTSAASVVAVDGGTLAVLPDLRIS
jgi:hypothetical protein